MPTSFRQPFNVIKRNMGTWTNGVYMPDDDIGVQISIMATVQMPSTSDMEKIEAFPYGRRAGRHIKFYTNTRLQPVNQGIKPGEPSYPGDLFLYDNKTFLIFGEADFTMLSRSRSTQVSHWRYYACEMIEGFTAEGAP